MVFCQKLVRLFNVLVRSYGDEFVGCPYQNLTLVVSAKRLLGHERG